MQMRTYGVEGYVYDHLGRIHVKEVASLQRKAAEYKLFYKAFKVYRGLTSLRLCSFILTFER